MWCIIWNIGTGTTAVYLIDLGKTRMQYLRSFLAGEIMYQNIFHYFFKVIHQEGFLDYIKVSSVSVKYIVGYIGFILYAIIFIKVLILNEYICMAVC